MLLATMGITVVMQMAETAQDTDMRIRIHRMLLIKLQLLTGVDYKIQLLLQTRIILLLQTAILLLLLKGNLYLGRLAWRVDYYVVERRGTAELGRSVKLIDVLDYMCCVG
jgi:hypothetical protein